MILKNPIVASSSPLAAEVDGIRQLEDAAVSAVVLPSLFEEDIELEARLVDDPDARMHAGITYEPEYFPRMAQAEEFATLIDDAKHAVQLPIIASLNGVTPGGWMRHATLLEQAGADALELNLYSFPTNPSVTGDDVEREYLEAARTVLAQIKIPVAVKISPFVSALPHLASQMSDAGVSGLVMFNRFYHPDVDIDHRQIVPRLGFSRSEDARLPIRWAAVLFGAVRLDLAVTGGIRTHVDVLKAIMAGANVTMMCSELLEHGTRRVGDTLTQIKNWMEARGYGSIAELRGALSLKNVPNPILFERGSYVKVTRSYHVNSSSLASAYVRNVQEACAERHRETIP
jgi:dihydroorotate dehydrogenase (fumarate)